NLAHGGDNSGYGGAFGGGIFENPVAAGTTNLAGCTVTGNVAHAGDNGPGTSAAISGTTFSGNLAIGGNGGASPYVGEGAGGALANYGSAPGVTTITA